MRHIVKKDNKLIKGKYNLTLNEQRLILLSISQIRKEDLKNDNQVYHIDIDKIDKNFMKLNKTRLRDFCKKILEKPLEIKKENGGFIVVNWFSDIEYKPEINKLEVSFSNKIKPYLFELKENFSTYHIEEVLNFKSSYSIRFYEMLIQYKNTKHKTVEFELNEIYEMFKLPQSMRKISKFKEKILEPVTKDINEKSNIKIDWKLIKQGRSFTKIKFNFVQNIENIEKRKIIELESSEYWEKQLKEILKWYNNPCEINIKNKIEFSNDFIEHFFNKYFSNFFINKKFLINNENYKLLSYEEKLNTDKLKNPNQLKTFHISLINKNNDIMLDTTEISFIGLYFYLKDKITNSNNEDNFSYSTPKIEF